MANYKSWIFCTFYTIHFIFKWFNLTWGGIISKYCTPAKTSLLATTVQRLLELGVKSNAKQTFPSASQSTKSEGRYWIQQPTATNTPRYNPHINIHITTQIFLLKQLTHITQNNYNVIIKAGLKQRFLWFYYYRFNPVLHILTWIGSNNSW